MNKFGRFFSSRAKHTKVSKKYKFKQKRYWIHFDYWQSNKPHFVMYGKDRKPLVILGYYKTKHGKQEIVIKELQRTSKTRFFQGFSHEWDKHKHAQDLALERKRHELAEKEIGMHTSEFIFREFLFRNRDELLSGRTTLKIDPPKMKDERDLPYQTIINRYFGKKGEDGKYQLNLNKKRTKEVLFKGLVK